MNYSITQYESLRRANPDLVAPELEKPLKGFAPEEFDEQCAVVQWARANEDRYPALRWLYHTPNAEKDARQRAIEAAAGVKAGVPDLKLEHLKARPDGGVYVGIAIELKKRDRSNYPSSEQKEWIEHLRANDWVAVVCYGSAEAINALEHYVAE